MRKGTGASVKKTTQGERSSGESGFEVGGFRFGSATAGLKPSGLTDTALVVADAPVAAGGVFTRNRFRAAPVDLAVERLKAGRLRGLVVNSGNANACTGARGVEDARRMTELAAKAVGAAPEEIAPASTGLIGAPLAMGKLGGGIRRAATALDPAGASGFAEAIRTTDAFAKMVAAPVPAASGDATILGIAKGAGMIAPEMATLLVFVLTDADLRPAEARSLAREIARTSFNGLSVDGDTSTNDALFVLASGAKPLRRRGRGLPANFVETARQVGRDLAVLVARDGEGATRVVRLSVCGAATANEARRVARTVTRSTLVKAAFHGADPNWGRIACAVGYSGVPVDPERVKIAIGGVEVFAGGLGVAGARARARRRMCRDEVEVRIDLGRGKAHASAITSDLSPAYVEFNSAYTT